MPSIQTMQKLSADESFEYFYALLNQYLMENKIDEAVALCGEHKISEINTKTEKYGHVFLEMALLNLPEEKVEQLCANDDFLNLLASKIHHYSHLLSLYDQIPAVYLFKFFSKVEPAIFWRLYHSKEPVADSLNKEYLDLWLATTCEKDKEEFFLVDAGRELNFIKQIAKETLLNFVKNKPNKLLLLLKLIPNVDGKSALLLYLNSTFNTVLDMKIINGERKRSDRWYKNANFVMTLLLRPDGYKAYYQGRHLATEEEAELLDLCIVREDMVLDNGDAIAVALDLTPAHQQRSLLQNWHDRKIIRNISALVHTPFELNAILDSIHFKNTKIFFMHMLSKSMPSDDWVDKLYSSGHGASKALAEIRVNPINFEVLQPYLKTIPRRASDIGFSGVVSVVGFSPRMDMQQSAAAEFASIKEKTRSRAATK